MDKNKKKMAAAITAVMNYMLEEAAVVVTAPPQKKPIPATVNMWGISGRQDMMQIRSLMQMRAFKGTRW